MYLQRCVLLVNHPVTMCISWTGAVELRKDLSILTSLDLPATLIFDYPSIAEMTSALNAMLPTATPAPTAAAKPASKAPAPRVEDAKRTPNLRMAAASGKAMASYWLSQVNFCSSLSSCLSCEFHHMKILSRFCCLIGLIAGNAHWSATIYDRIGNWAYMQVLGAIQTITGADVRAEAPLMSAGLDSLGAVELRKELATLSGLELPATLIFDYPSGEAIAGFLASQFAAPPQGADISRQPCPPFWDGMS